MGRVSKYKKIKACDPFSKQNGGQQSMTGVWGFGDNGRRKKKRSATATALKDKKRKRSRDSTTLNKVQDAFDLAPTGGDDFDLNDLLQIKKQRAPINELIEETLMSKTDSEASLKVGSQIQTDSTLPVHWDLLEEETRVARLLKMDEQKEATTKPAASLDLVRLPGESHKAHQRRLKTATQKIIRKDRLERQNPEKRRRKKDFLSNKKRKKQKRQTNNEARSDDDNDYRSSRASDHDATDTFITGEQAAQRVGFGDQVERPPTFLQLPRGVTKTLSGAMNSKSTGLSDAAVEAEKKAMEKMRIKIQAQYALLKAKRKKAGDFHL